MVGVKGTRQLHVKILDEVSPRYAILGGILYRARLDAERGNLAALAWLVVEGARYAELISPGGKEVTLEFAREMFDRFCDQNTINRWAME